MRLVKQNFHTHTNFCDGANSVEEMPQAAIKCGLTSLGFSSHAYTPHDESYCMKLEDYEKYRDEVLSAKEKYKSQIKIYLGIEQDYYSVPPTIDLDYIIGSVHYVEKDGVITPVDETREHIENAVKNIYGDIYTFIEKYYQTVADVVNKTNCDIIGHFDLCEKFNGDGTLFDRENPRYINAYKKAVDQLIPSGKIFEINTGAMARGYTDFPYPHKNILDYISKCGGKFIISSDSHSVDTVDYKLESVYNYASTILNLNLITK